MMRLVLALAIATALVSCKDPADIPPPYTPDPGAVKQVDDAAPEPPPAPPIDAADGLLGEDRSVVECVDDCVRSKRARAKAADAIRLECIDLCEGRCLERCVARAAQRGIADGGIWDDCANVCRMQ